MAYRKRSCRRHSSAASFVGTPKIASSAAMRDERSRIFLAAKAVSCGWCVRGGSEQGIVNELRYSYKWSR